MRAANLVLVVLSACFSQQASAVLRTASVFERRDNPLKGLGDKAKNAAKTLKDKATQGGLKKPMMDSIEVMRAMMCWGRPKLIEHDKCMKWMSDNCMEETTGEGYCKKLRRYVKAECRKGKEKACMYAKKMNIKVDDDEVIAVDDEDGDGVPDAEDAFPDNPLETKDSDGDGVGDNMDIDPLDPSCSNEGDVCKSHPLSPAGAPSPAAATPPAPAPGPTPDGLTMSESIPLPSQGYNELSNTYVAHNDGTSMTRDWRREWPASGKTEEQSVASICEKNPKLAWCKLYSSSSARKKYAASHP